MRSLFVPSFILHMFSNDNIFCPRPSYKFSSLLQVSLLRVPGIFFLQLFLLWLSRRMPYIITYKRTRRRTYIYFCEKFLVLQDFFLHCFADITKFACTIGEMFTYFGVKLFWICQSTFLSLVLCNHLIYVNPFQCLGDSAHSCECESASFTLTPIFVNSCCASDSNEEKD